MRPRRDKCGVDLISDVLWYGEPNAVSNAIAYLSGEECHELAEKYFETHKQMTLPGQVLLVDLRLLADVTPRFRAVSKGHTFTPQR